MTGFARVRRVLPEGELVVSLKSVNHRGLDLHFHLPPEFDEFEQAIRTAIKGRVSRGHFQVNVFYGAENGNQSRLNRDLLQSWLAAFTEAAERFHLENKPDLNAAFRIPGMFQSAGPAIAGPEFGKILIETTMEALDTLNVFREREGCDIGAELRERCTAIRDLVARMETIRKSATPAFQKRLKERLGELLRTNGIEPQRIAQEAALLADRSDVSEELVRLKTHAAQLEELLDAGGEMGKKMDFLLQEMNREANTILSKTGGLGDIGLAMTDLALAGKAEIDKIREQALNIE